MAAQSWLDGSMEDAIEMLAKLAVVARRVRSAREKTALDLSDVGQQLKGYGTKALDWVNAPGKQHLRYPLVGAGVGGLLGGLSSLGRPKEERQTLRSMLTGGIAGAGLGLGGGLLAKNWKKIWPGPGPDPGPDPVEELKDELAKRAPGWLPSRKTLGAGVGLAAGSEMLARSTPGALSRGAGLEPGGRTEGTPLNALRGGDVGTKAKLRAIAESRGLRPPVKPQLGSPWLHPVQPPSVSWLKRLQLPFSPKQRQANLPSTAIPGVTRGGVRAMGRAGAAPLRKTRLSLLLALPYVWQLLRGDKAQQAAETGALKAYEGGKS